MNSFGMSAHDEPENFFDDAIRKKEHAFVVFSSKRIIRLIEKLPLEDINVLMDATFRIVPIGEFKQLLVLYTRIQYEVTFDGVLFVVQYGMYL